MNVFARFFVIVAVLWLPAIAQCETKQLPQVPPASIGMDAKRLAHINEVVEEGLQRGRMPGCVVLVGRSDGIAHFKSYGFRQLLPKKVAMTNDTLFDLASLTKPIATATSIMTLIEKGKLNLDDRVAKYIPEFSAEGKGQVTIRQLLTHQSGLIADNSLRDYAQGPEEAYRRINALKLTAAESPKFTYSDVGFIVLGKVVEKVSGSSLHKYSQQTLFKPLGMSDTGYLPRRELKQRAAVTEKRDGRWMQGEVHDPRAFAVGGVAGHAGLFSTADDLAKFAAAMLVVGDNAVLKSETMNLMTADTKTSGGIRGLGWDKKSVYSSNRGDLFTPKAFGHGGFTGTAIWIDPGQDLFVIFLSNRVHPNGKGSVNTLIGRVGTIAAAAINK
ncbi:MAG: beta-lactamase family protein [bacterium]|nr:beta-lactamase family protein [bacterium]